MNATPPPDDAADDLDSLYRKGAARDASRPSARTRQAILDYSSRMAARRLDAQQADRPHPREDSRARRGLARGVRPSGPRWRQSLVVGSLAAAALAGVLIAPQFLPLAPPPAPPAPPAAPPAAGPAARQAAVPEPRASGPALQAEAPVAAVEEAAPRRTAAVPALPAAPAPAVPVPATPRPSQDAPAVSASADQVAPAAGAPASRAAAISRPPEPERAPAATDSVDARDSDGRTPLMRAVLQGRLDSINDLIRRGADPNAADFAGVTPLHAARARNEREIAEALVRAGAR